MKILSLICNIGCLGGWAAGPKIAIVIGQLWTLLFLNGTSGHGATANQLSYHPCSNTIHIQSAIREVQQRKLFRFMIINCHLIIDCNLHLCAQTLETREVFMQAAPDQTKDRMPLGMMKHRLLPNECRCWTPRLHVYNSMSCIQYFIYIFPKNSFSEYPHWNMLKE